MSEEVPRDVVTIDRILKSMGIEKYDPCVTEQLLDILYRYVDEIVEDAHVFKNHAGREEMEADDVKLSIANKSHFQYVEVPNLEFLLPLATQKNSQPIMTVEKPTVLLPPKEHCLTEINYKL
jgi:transcription initiation factor TFIID subunit 9B